MIKVLCKHWIDCGVPGHGDCAIGVRQRPKIGFCNKSCHRYYEEGRLPRERTKVKSKIGSFIKAHEELLLQGPVREEVADYRLTVCTGRTENNGQVTASCIHYKGEKKIRGDGHCGACSCPDWKISEMRKKVYYPMECPVNRFSAMPGKRKKI